MYAIYKHIPNGITCLNLLSGGLSIIYTLHEGDLYVAAMLIVLSAVFDFFDGLVARLLHASSPIGKDLDSLADVISFGLAPAVLVFHQMLMLDYTFWGSVPVLIIVAFAALRLAKFNNDTRQSTNFIGLPVPANAIFWIGIQTILPSLHLLAGNTLTMTIIYILLAIFSFLMVSEIPMFSFKIKTLSKSYLQIALIVISAGAIGYFGMLGCSISIVVYILLSIFQQKASFDAIDQQKE